MAFIRDVTESTGLHRPLESREMPEAQIVALPVPARVRGRAYKSAPSLRSPARAYRAPVVPLFMAHPFARERSKAGLGIAIAFGFSAICWGGLALAIF